MLLMKRPGEAIQFELRADDDRFMASTRLVKRYRVAKRPIAQALCKERADRSGKAKAGAGLPLEELAQDLTGPLARWNQGRPSQRGLELPACRAQASRRAGGRLAFQTGNDASGDILLGTRCGQPQGPY